MPDYSIDLPASEEEPLVLDWAPMLRSILRDLDVGVSPGKIAAGFHRALAASIAAVAARIGVRRVALSGGCFQNRHLLEQSVGRLRAAGLEPYWHRLAPTNDGGISLGQAAWAAAQQGEG